MAGHWSRDQYTLWWRDRGIGRKRVSFSTSADVLLKRLERVWHEDIDAALWAPDGERVALRRPEPKAPKKKGKKAAAAPEGASAEAAVA
jgi:hypothetical protein